MRTVNAVAAATILVVLICGPYAHGQWQQVPDQSIPRTSDGQPDLAAPVPRAADGKPDLTGVWLPDADPLPEGLDAVEGDLPVPRHMITITADLEPEEVVLTPWAAELFGQRLENRGMDSPPAHCKPTGVPLLNAMVLPYKIVQTPDLVVILYEENTVFRQIFLDGREPIEDPLLRWMGYSTGRWVDDELVVDTIGLTAESWLDLMGHPHTDSMHVIERFRRLDTGHLEVETTIDDAGAYAQPVTYTVPATVMPDDDLLEYFCAENELSSAHYQ
jgi:hypothetical protein